MVFLRPVEWIKEFQVGFSDLEQIPKFVCQLYAFLKASA